MSVYLPISTTKLSASPGHAKLHSVFAMNVGPSSPNQSVEVDHYGNVRMPYSLAIGYNKYGHGYLDLATYFASLYYMDINGFACDFDVPNQFMYPYVNTDLF